MTRNLRGAYMTYTHDRAEDWDWLLRWQPNVIRLMLHGSHTDPASVDVTRIRRVHDTVPGATLLIRVWDVDDRSYAAHRNMRAEPIGTANNQHDWWRRLFDRVQGVPRAQLMAGSNNEPDTRDNGEAVRVYNQQLAANGTRDSVRYGLYCFSVGNPAKAGEHQFDWPYYAKLEDAVVAGNHALVLHEYMQPEGMYGVWTDDTGTERHDWTNLMGRHLDSGVTRANIIIGEWGLDGLLFNRYPDHTKDADGNEYGNSGWRNFPDLWAPDRYADEYVAYLHQCAPNVIGVCPFLSDEPAAKWHSFDMATAYGALLNRRQLTETVQPPQHTVNLPIVTVGTPPSDVVTDPPATRPDIFLPSKPDNGTDATNSSENWRKSREFVKRWEGGWADHPADHGGPTNKGVTMPTFRRWRALQGMGEPSVDDLRNLSDEEADALYHQLYWVASGAATQPWPQSLVTFDTAVLHGVEAAMWFNGEVGDSALGVLGLRLLTYAASIDREPSQAAFWSGWRNRTMQLRTIVRQAAGQPV